MKSAKPYRPTFPRAGNTFNWAMHAAPTEAGGIAAPVTCTPAADEMAKAQRALTEASIVLRGYPPGGQVLSSSRADLAVAGVALAAAQWPALAAPGNLARDGATPTYFPWVASFIEAYGGLTAHAMVEAGYLVDARAGKSGKSRMWALAETAAPILARVSSAPRYACPTKLSAEGLALLEGSLMADGVPEPSHVLITDPAALLCLGAKLSNATGASLYVGSPSFAQARAACRRSTTGPSSRWLLGVPEPTADALSLMAEGVAIPDSRETRYLLAEAAECRARLLDPSKSATARAYVSFCPLSGAGAPYWLLARALMVAATAAGYMPHRAWVDRGCGPVSVPVVLDGASHDVPVFRPVKASASAYLSLAEAGHAREYVHDGPAWFPLLWAGCTPLQVASSFYAMWKLAGVSGVSVSALSPRQRADIFDASMGSMYPGWRIYTRDAMGILGLL